MVMAWRRRWGLGIPARFTSYRSGAKRTIRIRLRTGVTQAKQDGVAGALAEVDWAVHEHAYGPAHEVPALLFAVTHATGPVRGDAWWELWGNVHHQGTVYNATPPSVPFIANIAADPSHPDRVNAPATRSAVAARLPDLLASWDREPALVQRALVYLSSAFLGQAAAAGAVDSIVPEAHRVAWAELVAAGGDPTALVGDDDEPEGWAVQDRHEDLEAWAYAGWCEQLDASDTGRLEGERDE